MAVLILLLLVLLVLLVMVILFLLSGNVGPANGTTTITHRAANTHKLKHCPHLIDAVVSDILEQTTRIPGKKELSNLRKWVDNFLALKDFKDIHKDTNPTRDVKLDGHPNLHRWKEKQIHFRRTHSLNYDTLDLVKFRML